VFVVRILAVAPLVAAAVASSAPSVGAERGAIVGRRVVGGLQQVVAFTFDADGGIWFAEKAGRVGRFDPSTGATADVLELRDVVAEVEQGLVGIALDPRFLAETGTGMRPHQVKLAGGDASSDSFCFAA